MRTTYFRVKAEKLGEGMSEEEAKEKARKVAETDVEYDNDSAYGTDYSNENSDDTLDRDTPDSSDGDMSVDYASEEYERDGSNTVIIAD